MPQMTVFDSQKRANDLSANELSHFEIPTQFVSQICRNYDASEFGSKSKIDFTHDTMESQINEIIQNQITCNTDHQESHMARGILSDEGLEEDFPTVLKMIGEFLSLSNPFQIKSKKAESAFLDYETTLLMTDSSMTLALPAKDGNKASLERQRQQRKKMCEIAFEQLGIKNFGLVPSQAPQIFSEMMHTGCVVDFGHEMTQIVPIEKGHIDYQSCIALPIGGSHIDKYYQAHIFGLNEIQRNN